MVQLLVGVLCVVWSLRGGAGGLSAQRVKRVRVTLCIVKCVLLYASRVGFCCNFFVRVCVCWRGA
jgi:hypothetical protein